MPSPPFRLSWLLVDELAIGSAPLDNASLEWLAKERVMSILSLCSELEAPAPPSLPERFPARRRPLL